jgi:hypothetical protein
MSVTYRIGGRIPDVMLPRADRPGNGALVPARGRPREAVALLLPDTSPDWPPYLRRLADLAADLVDWDGRIIGVAPSTDPGWMDLARELGSRAWIVHDPDHALRAAPGRSGVTTALPAAAIADRYGEIYHVWPRDDGDARPGPPPRELEEWLRYLALQCPE